MNILEMRAEIARVRKETVALMKSDKSYEYKAKRLAEPLTETRKLEATLDKWGGFVL